MKHFLLCIFFLYTSSFATISATEYETYISMFAENALFSSTNQMPVDLQTTLYRNDEAIPLEHRWERIFYYSDLPSELVTSFVNPQFLSRMKYSIRQMGKQCFPKFDVVFLRVYDLNRSHANPDHNMVYYLFVSYSKTGTILSKVRFGESRGGDVSPCVSQTYIVGNRIFSKTTPLDKVIPITETLTQAMTVISKCSVFLLTEDGHFIKEKEYQQKTTLLLHGKSVEGSSSDDENGQISLLVDGVLVGTLSDLSKL